MALTGLSVARLDAEVSRLQFGGRGQFALIQSEPGSLKFEDCKFRGDGTSSIYYAPGSVVDPVTQTVRPAGEIGALQLTDMDMTIGQYGFMFGGFANGVNHKQFVGSVDIQNNTFWGPNTMKKAFPNNTYMV
jgi:hypothetical protein